VAIRRKILRLSSGSKIKLTKQRARSKKYAEKTFICKSKFVLFIHLTPFKKIHIYEYFFFLNDDVSIETI
jgi:hypothetical protein